MLSRIFGRRRGEKIMLYTPGIEEITTRRETILNLSIVLPNSAAANEETIKISRLECVCIFVRAVDFDAAVVIAVCMVLYEMIVGMTLVLCFSLAVVALGVLGLGLVIGLKGAGFLSGHFRLLPGLCFLLEPSESFFNRRALSALWMDR